MNSIHAAIAVGAVAYWYLYIRHAWDSADWGDSLVWRRVNGDADE